MDIFEAKAKVEKQLLKNAITFLNESIRIYNTGIFDSKNMVLCAANLQICLELSIKYYASCNFGLDSILVLKNVKGPLESLSEADQTAIVDGIMNHTIKAKEFEAVKNSLKSKSGISAAISPYMQDIDTLQNYRNKLCHFVYFFSEKEIEDFVYLVLTIIFRVLCFIMKDKAIGALDDFEESILAYIDKKEYQKFLTNHQAFIELEDYLLDTYGDLYTCPLCSKTLLTPEKYCFSCFSKLDNYDIYGYKTCPKCGTSSSFLYDELNFSKNEWIPCLCLKCSHRDVIKKDDFNLL